MTMSMRSASNAVVIFLTAAVLLVACGDDDAPACVEGETEFCACPGSRTGVQACLAGGTYSACECTGGPDAGVVDSGTWCTRLQVPTAPPCALATKTCMQECADDSSCVSTCARNDPAAGCYDCVLATGWTCIARTGCDAELHALQCCLQSACGTEPLRTGCGGDECVLEGDAFFDRCLPTISVSCDNEWAACVP